MPSFVKLQNAVAESGNVVRDYVGQADVGSFELTITVSGRTMTDRDETKVEYRLGPQYGSQSVRGSELGPVLDEFLRRNGWDLRHAPKTLPSPGQRARKSKAYDAETSENVLDEG